MTLRIPLFHSILPYFNVSVCIYVEVTINPTEHVQMEKQIGLKANLPRPKFWPSRSITEVGENPIISNEEKHNHANLAWISSGKQEISVTQYVHI